MSKVIKFANVVLDDTPVTVKHNIPKIKKIDKDPETGEELEVSSEKEEKETEEKEKLSDIIANRDELLAEIEELRLKRIDIEKDTDDEVKKILADATAKAEKILSDANEKADFLFKRSENDGYDLGFGKGKAEGMKRAEEYVKEQTSDMLASIAEKITDIENQKERILQSYQEDIKFLSVEIAEKIIKSQIELDDSFVQNIVKAVLDDYKNKEWIRITVSSQGSFADCLSSEEFLQSLSLASKYIEVKKDPEAGRGTIKIETEQDIVDASIETQLKNINDTLKFDT